jgi:hypothetical protein
MQIKADAACWFKTQFQRVWIHNTPSTSTRLVDAIDPELKHPSNTRLHAPRTPVRWRSRRDQDP